MDNQVEAARLIHDGFVKLGQCILYSAFFMSVGFAVGMLLSH